MSRTYRHKSARQRQRLQRRTNALLGTVLFLALSTSSVAHAGWTTTALRATGSVASGSVTISQSGYDQLEFDYTASSLATTKPITVTNGSVPSTYTLTLSATTSSPAALAGAITVTTWPVTTPANCTSTTALPGTETVRTWASGTTLTGSLAATASLVHCVRTSMSSASYAGGRVEARLDLSAVVGANWATGKTSVTVVQAVPDVLAPTAPTNLTAASTTDASATLTWTAATDNVGVVSYRVYRDGVQSGSGITGTTFPDTGLNVGTTYSYTVEALDAAGNVSARSLTVLATTSQMPSSTSWYRVKSGGLCATASLSGKAAVTVQTCDDALATQLWQYDQVDRNAYSISSKADPTQALQRNSKTDIVVAKSLTTKTSQQWTGSLKPGGLFQFIPGSARSECLSVPAYTVGTALQTQSCDSSLITQQFTLTAANG